MASGDGRGWFPARKSPRAVASPFGQSSRAAIVRNKGVAFEPTVRCVVPCRIQFGPEKISKEKKITPPERTHNIYQKLFRTQESEMNLGREKGVRKKKMLSSCAAHIHHQTKMANSPSRRDLRLEISLL